MKSKFQIITSFCSFLQISCVFSQNTPSWSGVTTVKILEVLPKGKVRVKAGESIFVRSIQYMFNTAKDANTSRRAWEYSSSASRKRFSQR